VRVLQTQVVMAGEPRGTYGLHASSLRIRTGRTGLRVPTIAPNWWLVLSIT
jgi:hypothetical protein